MRDTAVLVTGGAGFIGSNLVDLLMEKGHTVYVLDDLSCGSLDNLEEWLEDPRFRFIRGDITSSIEDTIKSNIREGPPIGTIFHLAARVDVTSSFEDPKLDAYTNYIGTMNILGYALKNDVKRVIFSSSAAVYGDTAELPINEEDDRSPLSPYGLHKLSSEGLLEIYRKQWGLSSASVRFFNVYGPRQDPGNPYSGVISKFMDRAKMKEPLIIFGDGEQTRDFVYVGDVAEGLYQTAMSKVHGPINLGTGVETSVIDLAMTIRKVSMQELKMVHMPPRKGEIMRSVADISMIEKETGFSARMTIEQGLKRTYEWFSRRY